MTETLNQAEKQFLEKVKNLNDKDFLALVSEYVHSFAEMVDRPLDLIYLTAHGAHHLEHACEDVNKIAPTLRIVVKELTKALKDLTEDTKQ